MTNLFSSSKLNALMTLMTRSQAWPKAYAPEQAEQAVLDAWEASGAFDPDQLPDRNQRGEPYCIVLPPPNRTGVLHVGHAKMLAIEDALIRFHRMKGKKTYWVPGTDHAAISTQVKVEQQLMQQGIKDPRRELGRELFLEQVRAFAEHSRTTIIEQCRRMGASMDWKREKYTLDAERNHAVNTLFQMMHEDGLIERGERIVNWDPQFQTTLSDDEVFTKDVRAQLFTFVYDARFPIAISTTRPETKFGDTAVAVHPDDKRYASFVGKTFTPVFCGKPLTIKIIADVAVDPAFGTGALGVTPSHSLIDADLAERHQLPFETVIDARACMINVPEAVFGKTTLEARDLVVQQLIDTGLLRNTQEIDQALPIAERGGTPVEQRPMKQWFVRVNKPFALRQDTLGRWKKGERVTLKMLMQEAVQSRKIRIIPEHFEKIYFHWVEHLRDWCISRQIWFGHQIPVWYRQDTEHGIRNTEQKKHITQHTAADETNEEIRVSDVSPGEGWERDPDTLDTWFSSGMWTFSTLGWPEHASVDKDGKLVKTGELAIYHPTAVLETGYDILPFWVARMILMTTYALGEIPFQDVYLHGLVRDERGRKMSKSLGNVLDPLHVIPQYGTDAVRLSLVMGTAPGMDQKLSEEKIKDFRNFTNKLYNIGRFIFSLTEQPDETSVPKTIADQWIATRFHDVIRSVSQKMETYQFAQAGEELRQFTWEDLADWYVEIAKVEGGKAKWLRRLFLNVLRAWHPFMPFVTEHLWKLVNGEGLLMLAEWPSDQEKPLFDIQAFDGLRALVTNMRRLRAEQKIEPSKKIPFVIRGYIQGLEENRAWILRLANAASLDIVEMIDKTWPAIVSGTYTVACQKKEADAEQERRKREQDYAEAKTYADALEQKLTNREFVEKAPEHVIQAMRNKLEDARSRMAALQARIT